MKKTFLAKNTTFWGPKTFFFTFFMLFSLFTTFGTFWLKQNFFQNFDQKSEKNPVFARFLGKFQKKLKKNFFLPKLSKFHFTSDKITKSPEKMYFRGDIGNQSSLFCPFCPFLDPFLGNFEKNKFYFFWPITQFQGSLLISFWFHIDISYRFLKHLCNVKAVWRDVRTYGRTWTSDYINRYIY